jgi:hypothetical protein
MDICVYQCLSLLLNFGIFGVKTVSIIAKQDCVRCDVHLKKVDRALFNMISKMLYAFRSFLVFAFILICILPIIYP